MATTAAPPLSGSYTADPVHSSFGFAVRYQGVSLFRGTLDDVSATLTNGRLEGIAQVESISIRRPEQFRAHVMAPDFFDAENHPDVRFVADRVELAQDGTAQVPGELTLRGVTRPVQASGTWTAPGVDVFGKTRAHVQLEATINRTEFGMDWNAPLPSGGKALANEVTLTVDLALIEEA